MGDGLEESGKGTVRCGATGSPATEGSPWGETSVSVEVGEAVAGG